MIISASYKTDIPAFYGEWMMRRLRAGYCKMVNPYNARQVTHVSLAPEDVDGIVFWTKNLAPFAESLAEVTRLGHTFVVQYTINGYPKSLEHSVVSAERNVEQFRRAAERFGPAVCVWRYDTVVFSSDTPVDFHRRNFARLCRQLEGATDEVVASFMHVYQKTERNLNRAGEQFGFEWTDPSTDQKQSLAAEMVDMATAHGMQLMLCTQPEYLVPGAGEARCIDARRIERVSGRSIDAPLRGGRKECGCHASRDIGIYDTCPHGCVYCYAVRSQKLAARRFREHDPNGEFLFRTQSVG